MSSLQRVGVKLFCRESDGFPLVDVIPIFHSWIQHSAVPGLLIDVADYSHVPDGPGVVLVSHEGIYALDQSRSRRGMAYSARFPGFETSADCLRWSMRAAVTACVLLENDSAGKIRFAADELEVFVNDRLKAPNDAGGIAMLNEELTQFLAEIHPGTTWDVTGDSDPRQRLSLTARSRSPFDLAAFAEAVLP